MLQFSLFRGRALLRLVAVLVLVLVGMGPQAAWATHIRAGDIQAKVDTTANPDPRRIFFKMTLYTDPVAPGKQPAATIFFGDGTSSCVNGIPRVLERPVAGTRKRPFFGLICEG
jgi:hypothetical protein